MVTVQEARTELERVKQELSMQKELTEAEKLKIQSVQLPIIPRKQLQFRGILELVKRKLQGVRLGEQKLQAMGQISGFEEQLKGREQALSQYEQEIAAFEAQQAEYERQLQEYEYLEKLRGKELTLAGVLSPSEERKLKKMKPPSQAEINVAVSRITGTPLEMVEQGKLGEITKQQELQLRAAGIEVTRTEVPGVKEAPIEFVPVPVTLPPEAPVTTMLGGIGGITGVIRGFRGRETMTTTELPATTYVPGKVSEPTITTTFTPTEWENPLTGEQVSAAEAPGPLWKPIITDFQGRTFDIISPPGLPPIYMPREKDLKLWHDTLSGRDILSLERPTATSIEIPKPEPGILQRGLERFGGLTSQAMGYGAAFMGAVGLPQMRLYQSLRERFPEIPEAERRIRERAAEVAKIGLWDVPEWMITELPGPVRGTEEIAKGLRGLGIGEYQIPTKAFFQPTSLLAPPPMVWEEQVTGERVSSAVQPGPSWKPAFQITTADLFRGGILPEALIGTGILPYKTTVSPETLPTITRFGGEVAYLSALPTGYLAATGAGLLTAPSATPEERMTGTFLLGAIPVGYGLGKAYEFFKPVKEIRYPKQPTPVVFETRGIQPTRYMGETYYLPTAEYAGFAFRKPPEYMITSKFRETFGMKPKVEWTPMGVPKVKPWSPFLGQPVYGELPYVAQEFRAQKIIPDIIYRGGKPRLSIISPVEKSITLTPEKIAKLPPELRYVWLGKEGGIAYKEGDIFTQSILRKTKQISLPGKAEDIFYVAATERPFITTEAGKGISFAKLKFKDISKPFYRAAGKPAKLKQVIFDLGELPEVTIGKDITISKFFEKAGIKAKVPEGKVIQTLQMLEKVKPVLPIPPRTVLKPPVPRIKALKPISIIKKAITPLIGIQRMFGGAGLTEAQIRQAQGFGLGGEVKFIDAEDVQEPIGKGIIKTITTFKLKPGLKPISALKPTLKIKQALLLKPALKPLVKPAVSAILKDELALKPALKPALKSELALKQVLALKTAVKITPRVTPKPRIGRPPPPIPPWKWRFKFPLPPTPLGEGPIIKKTQPTGLFIPEVRRKGVFLAVGKPTTFLGALEIGKKKVKETLGASLRVRAVKTGKIVPLKPIGVFRPAKREAGIIVQVKGARLMAKSERKEIQAARRAAKWWK